VVLADEHDLIRAGIRAFLEKLPHVHVTGEASRLASITRQTSRSAAAAPHATGPSAAMR
jgi:DNA-binding NarL/FixJ family response regulator